MNSTTPSIYGSATRAVVLTTLAFLATLLGYAADTIRIVDPSLVNETSVFIISIGFALTRYFRPEPVAALSTKLIFLSACSACLISVLLIAGDDFGIAAIAASKWLIFFSTAFLILWTPSSSIYVMTWILFFFAGVASNRYLRGIPLFQIIKYTLPPLYIFVLVGLSTIKTRGTFPLFLISVIMMALAAFGAFFGGSRGSWLGTLVIALALLASMLRSLREVIFRLRIYISIMISLFSAILPLVFVYAIPLSRIQNSIFATKSNIERSASLFLASDQIMKNPITGYGVSGSFTELRKLFARDLTGFDATSSIHNQVIDIALYSGLPMSLAFCFLYSSIFSWIFKYSLGALPGRNREQEVFLGLTSLGAVAALATMMSLAPFASTNRCHALVCIAAAAVHFTKRAE